MIVEPKRINKQLPPSCSHASKDELFTYELVGSSTCRRISQHDHSLTSIHANNLLDTHNLNTRLRVGNSSMASCGDDPQVDLSEDELRLQSLVTKENERKPKTAVAQGQKRRGRQRFGNTLLEREKTMIEPSATIVGKRWHVQQDQEQQA